MSTKKRQPKPACARVTKTKDLMAGHVIQFLGKPELFVVTHLELQHYPGTGRCNCEERGYWCDCAPALPATTIYIVHVMELSESGTDWGGQERVLRVSYHT